MSKEKLRSLILGANRNFKRETVEHEGEVFEVIQPTIKERAGFRESALTIGAGDDGKGSAKFNMGEFALQAVIGLTVVPGTVERVFSDTDREALEALPSGGLFDKLSDAAQKLCNLEDDKVKKP